jgi:hypothetical protein
VFGAVINGVEPAPPALVELLEREPNLGIQFGQKLLANGPEKTLDLAAAFGRIGRRVHDQDAAGGGDAAQLRRTIDFAVVHIQAHGDATCSDGLT